MPVYVKEEMKEVKDLYLPTMQKTVVGEFMKVGFVVYQMGEGPDPHVHKNEEQFLLLLRGRLAMILDDDEHLVNPGDLVHIPRDTVHGIRVVEAPAEFFVAKSPTHTGALSSDYSRSDKADEVKERLRTLG